MCNFINIKKRSFFMQKNFFTRIILFVAMFFYLGFCIPGQANAETTETVTTSDKTVFTISKEIEKSEEGEVTKVKKVTFIGVTDDYEKEVANIPSSIYENYCLSVTSKIFTRASKDSKFTEDSDTYMPYTPDTSTTYSHEKKYSMNEKEPTQTIACVVLYEFDSSDLKFTPISNINEIPDNVRSYEQVIIQWVSAEYVVNDVTIERQGKLTTLTIPKTIDSIKTDGYPYGLLSRSFKKFTVDENNANFSSDDNGVLFNKNKTTLICFPMLSENKSIYEIPSTVTKINSYAFSGSERYDDNVSYESQSFPLVKIPANVKTFEERAFDCASFNELNLSKITYDNYTSLISGDNFVYAKTFWFPEPDEDGNLSMSFRCRDSKVVKISSKVKKFSIDDIEGGAQTGDIFNNETIESILDLEGNNFNNDYYEFDGENFIEKSTQKILKVMPGIKKETYTQPSGIKSFDVWAMLNVKNVKEISFSEGLLYIPYLCCSESESLKKIVFPKSLVGIGAYSFLACQKLSELEFKGVPTYLGGGAFSQCPIEKITVGCDFDLRNFEGSGLKVKLVNNSIKLFNGDDKEVSVVITHDAGYDVESDQVICANCKSPVSTPVHTCEYTAANCIAQEYCPICGKTKRDSAINPNAHKYSINAETGAITCSLCGKTATSAGHKIIITRTTPILSYGTDTDLSKFAGDKENNSPTPKNPQILTLNNFEGENFTFTLKLAKNQNIRDYQVTANNTVLNETDNKDMTYTYSINVDEPLTFINIEPVCDPTNDGIFTKAKEFLAAFQCSWR